MFYKMVAASPATYCLNPIRRQFGDRKISSHGIYIPNGCKHFKVFLQLFHGSEANSNKPLKNEKKILELRD